MIRCTFFSLDQRIVPLSLLVFSWILFALAVDQDIDITARTANQQQQQQQEQEQAQSVTPSLRGVPSSSSSSSSSSSPRDEEDTDHDDVNVLPLSRFEPSSSSQALCLDGSIGGYHSRVGSKTQLLISLPGGGWCWNDDTCLQRAHTSLGSMERYMKEFGTTRRVGQGELNGIPSLNPYFHHYSMLSPVYCDGSNFAGAMDHTIILTPTNVTTFVGNGNDTTRNNNAGGTTTTTTTTTRNNETRTIYVRGRAILQATLDVALDEWGLKHTLQEVVLTGCSAGGTATYFNVDWVHDYVKSKLVHTTTTTTTTTTTSNNTKFKMRAFGNAGWFLDTNSQSWNGDGWDHVPGIQRTVDKELFGYAGLSATLSTQCQATYAAIDESWKCAMSQYLYPFIKQPVLVLQSSYDLNQLLTGGPECVKQSVQNTFAGGIPSRPFPHSLDNCSTTEIEVVNRYADALNASLFGARHSAMFAPTCTIHCYTSFWTTIGIRGVRMVDAIGQFVAAANPSGMLWYDTCRGGNCNPTCPIKSPHAREFNLEGEKK